MTKYVTTFDKRMWSGCHVCQTPEELKSLFTELLFVESVQFRTGITRRVKVKVCVWIRERDRVESLYFQI